MADHDGIFNGVLHCSRRMTEDESSVISASEVTTYGRIEICILIIIITIIPAMNWLFGLNELDAVFVVTSHGDMKVCCCRRLAGILHVMDKPD